MASWGIKPNKSLRSTNLFLLGNNGFIKGQDDAGKIIINEDFSERWIPGDSTDQVWNGNKDNAYTGNYDTWDTDRIQKGTKLPDKNGIM
jgi:hypothetical protein